MLFSNIENQLQFVQPLEEVHHISYNDTYKLYKLSLIMLPTFLIVLGLIHTHCFELLFLLLLLLTCCYLLSFIFHIIKYNHFYIIKHHLFDVKYAHLYCYKNLHRGIYD